MSVHLQRAIDDLKKNILSLSAWVEDQVQMAIRALLERDEDLAAAVEERDAKTDQREVAIEEECLKMLALYQPVAMDLRLVVAVLKINSDLERIGDMAVNIAHKSRRLAHESPMETPPDIGEMFERVGAMLRDSIDSLVNLDARLASEVCGRDNEVNRLKHAFRVKTEEMMHRDPDSIGRLLQLQAVARNLERIGDCATNIAEDVIYMTEGRIARHRANDAS
jgi:phosphate transport system protein